MTDANDDTRGRPRPETCPPGGPERRDTARATDDADQRRLIARRVAAFMGAINTPTEQHTDREDPL